MTIPPGSIALKVAAAARRGLQLSANSLLGHALMQYIVASDITKLALAIRTGRARGCPMKLPGPDHPITISVNPKRVRISLGGIVIADSANALTLKEANYPAVNYVPRADANMALMARTERVTHCPYKGDANYFSIVADGKTVENAIWTYETPFPAMTEISGHLAFYPDKVKIEEVT
jgi:uncharacterized protein (DUF427 family)